MLPLCVQTGILGELSGIGAGISHLSKHYREAEDCPAFKQKWRGRRLLSYRETVLAFPLTWPGRKGLPSHSLHSRCSQVLALRTILHLDKNHCLETPPISCHCPSQGTKTVFQANRISPHQACQPSGPVCLTLFLFTPVGPGAPRCLHAIHLCHQLPSVLPSWKTLFPPISKTLSRTNLIPTSPTSLSMTKPVCLVTSPNFHSTLSQQ